MAKKAPKCPNKESKLYKRLINQLPLREAYKFYYTLTSEEFDGWFKNGSRDSEGNPILNKYFVAKNSDGKTYAFSERIEFKSVQELENFFSSERTEGISKLGDNYYVSKNSREEGIKWFSMLDSKYPGLIKLSQYSNTTESLGGTDQSMPIARIVINKDYFNQEVYYAVADAVEVIKVDPRDFIIKRLKEHNQRIYDKLKDSKKDKNKEDIIKYSELHAKTYDHIATLQTERTIASIMEKAEIDLNYATSILNNPNSNPIDIREAGILIELYENISNVDSKSSLISPSDLLASPIIKLDATGEEIIVMDRTELTKSIIALGQEFNNLSKTYDKVVKEIGTSEFNSEFNKDISEEELFAPIKDLKWSAGGRGVNSMGNRIISLLYSLRSNSIHRANTKTKQDNDERTNMLEGLKKSSLFKSMGKEKFMKFLWQKNKDKKETGNLLNRFSQEYWDFIKKYSSDLRSKDSKKINAAKQSHYNNHEYINYFETEEEKQAEIVRLSEFIGIDLANSVVNEHGGKFQDYRDLKESKIEQLNDTDLSKEEIEFEIDKWVYENSPEETIKNLEFPVSRTNPNGGYFYNSFEYVRSIPLDINRKGVETEWYDRDFEKLEQDEEALKYYEYVRAKMKELIKAFPQSYLEDKGISNGFIPQIKIEFMKDLHKKGSTGIMKGVKAGIKALYSIKTYSKTYDHINPDGTTISTLNIGMLSPTFKTVENGKIVETTSIITDIDEILSEFIPVSNLYKYKKGIEDTYNLVAESAKQLKGVKTSSSGSTVIGTDETVAAHLTKLHEMVQFEVDTFYGVNDSKHEKASKEKSLTSDEKIELAEINEEIKSIQEQLENSDDLTKEEEDELNSKRIYLENKTNDIGRNVSGTKALKSVLKWYQLTAQGWNIHSPIIELVYGAMSNFTHSSGEGDFTSKQMNRAYRIALSNSKKFKNVVEKFNMVGEVTDNDKNYATNSSNIKMTVGKSLKPYQLARLADRISKGSGGVAVLLNTKIYDKNGEESNIYDSLDDFGNLKEIFKTDENIAKWEINLDSKEANDILRLRSKISEVNIRNMGNYDPNQPIPFNSKAAGKAVLQFRRWLLEGVAQRFEGSRQSETLNRTIKGRYVTYKDIYMNPNQGLKTLSSTFFLLLANRLTLGAVKVTDEQLMELGIEESVDIENMKKNATGVMFAIMIWMALMLLSSLADDDEDKDFSSLKYLMNLGGRLQQDLWFYSNPGEANNFLGNIIPVTKLYDKVIAFGEAAVYEVFPKEGWENTLQSGDFKGWNKTVIKLGELLPGVSSVVKAKRLGSKVMD